MTNLSKIIRNLVISTIIFSTMTASVIGYFAYSTDEKFITILMDWFDSPQTMFIYFVSPILCMTIFASAKKRHV